MFVEIVLTWLFDGLNGCWVNLIDCAQFCATSPLLLYCTTPVYFCQSAASIAKVMWNYAEVSCGSTVWAFIFVLRGTIAGPPPPFLQCPACSFSAQGFCLEPHAADVPRMRWMSYWNRCAIHKAFEKFLLPETQMPHLCYLVESPFFFSSHFSLKCIIVYECQWYFDELTHERVLLNIYCCVNIKI